MNKRFIIALIVVLLSVLAIIITGGFVIKNQIDEPEQWVLHSYGNNVALYKGDEIVEVYGSIALDILPEEDKRMLDNGIAFNTKEEALSAMEDYDG